jgi:hypothetical protein
VDPSRIGAGPSCVADLNPFGILQGADGAVFVVDLSGAIRFGGFMRNRVLTVAVLSVLMVSMAAPAFAHLEDAPILTFSFTFTFHGVSVPLHPDYRDNNHNGRPNLGDGFVSVSIVPVG